MAEEREVAQPPATAAEKAALFLLEKRLVPDAVVRTVLRSHFSSLLRRFGKPTAELRLQDLLHFVKSVKEMPIAINAEEAKNQVYELPISFFTPVIGKRMKHGCCYFSDKSTTLDEAEEAMLDMYCKKANLQDGQSVLDLGCGWGSLIIHIAQKYPNCKITGITYSAKQKEFIDEQCRNLGLVNVETIDADISKFEMEGTYDRIFSIEMFEHMKNYKDLLKKISKWMKEDSLLFVEHLCHKTLAYNYEDNDGEDMDLIAKYFVSGGTMMSANLLLYFQEDVSVVDHWLVNGKHFARTSEEWLRRMDKNLGEIKPIMESIYGKEEAPKWTAYWRTYTLSTVEMFNYNNGDEWMVAHYLFKKN